MVSFGDLLDLRTGAFGIGVKYWQVPEVVDGEVQGACTDQKHQRLDLGLPDAAIAVGTAKRLDQSMST